MADVDVDVEKETLVEFLAYQRASVHAILAGLDEVVLSAYVPPFDWTPLGLIEHLGHAERHWFQEVLVGSVGPLPWPEGDAAPTGARGWGCDDEATSHWRRSGSTCAGADRRERAVQAGRLRFGCYGSAVVDDSRAVGERATSRRAAQGGV